MKKIILFLSVFALALLTSCEKDPVNDRGKLDPNATIKIRPAAGVKLRSAGTGQLTALEIVQQTYNMQWMYEPENPIDPITRGFSQPQRDYETPLLKMWGTDIINQDGEYVTVFIGGHDIVLLRKIFIRAVDGEIVVMNPLTIEYEGERSSPDDIFKDDTIAYIPNATIAAARLAVKDAYDAGNYDEVYRLFDSAYTFHPITGTEYKELKKQNLN